MTKRTLSQKRLRHILWDKAGGRCQICGCNLPPNWHADHIVPFVVSKRTNVEEMQALCPSCNIKKGSSMLRQFQVSFEDICKRDDSPKFLLANVTPGGGKSFLPVLFAREYFRKRVATKICWVVPRKSLQTQAARTFLDTRTKLSHSLSIREATNDDNLPQNTNGWVTTYQAIAADLTSRNYLAFKKEPTILVLDEAHHVSDEESWERQMKPLIAEAKAVLFMSGTWERGDGRKIAFLPYERTHPNSNQLNIDFQAWPSVSYSRKEALRDKAIVPIEFIHADGAVEWIDPQGETKKLENFDDAEGEDRGGALYAALETTYSEMLLDSALNHWEQYRKEHPWAQLLVVAHSQNAAKNRYLPMISVKTKARVDVATSSESVSAKTAIERFRAGSLDVLVTVAMAYEGFDAPAVTHIACLTHIRSKPWIEQMLARAVRRFKNKTIGFAFVPDDPAMNEVITRIKEEQIAAAREMEPRDCGGDGRGKPTDILDRRIIPIASVMTETRQSELDGETECTSEELLGLQRLREQFGNSEIGLVKMLRHLGISLDKIADGEHKKLLPTTTDAQNREALKIGLQNRANSVDARLNRRKGATNSELVQRFGKPRDACSVEELRAQYQYLNRTYP